MAAEDSARARTGSRSGKCHKWYHGASLKNLDEGSVLDNSMSSMSSSSTRLFYIAKCKKMLLFLDITD